MLFRRSKDIDFGRRCRIILLCSSASLKPRYSSVRISTVIPGEDETNKLPHPPRRVLQLWLIYFVPERHPLRVPGKSVSSRGHLIKHHHLHALFSDIGVHTHLTFGRLPVTAHGPPPIQTILSAIPVVLSYNNLYYRVPPFTARCLFPPQATFLPTLTLVIRNLMNRLCSHTPSVLHTPVNRPFLSGLASAQLPNGF